MDGLTFLKKLMSQHPIPVVICSSLAEEGAQSTLRALEYGAVDIITKPRLGTKQFLEDSRAEICEAVKAAAQARGPALPALAKSRTEADRGRDSYPLRLMPWLKPPKKSWSSAHRQAAPKPSKLLLESFPADTPGIVIVQHMPELFTRAFASRLDGLCAITVKEAETNDTVLRGRALIAPGNHHLLLKRSGARYLRRSQRRPARLPSPAVG